MSPQQSKKILTKYLYKVLKSLGVKVFRLMIITNCSKPENSVWDILDSDVSFPDEPTH